MFLDVNTKTKETTEVCMGKTSKLLYITVIAAAIVFFLAGCGNPAMEPNETEYILNSLESYN
jgi:hypothetical protein